MSYLFKALFLTVSYLVLLHGISDLDMFFVSLLIFAGGILFDLYFAYRTSTAKAESLSLSIVRFVICGISIISVLCVMVAFLGMANIVCVEPMSAGKYIILENKEVRDTIAILGRIKIPFGGFLLFVIVQVFSCGTDYLINKMEHKEEQKKERRVNCVNDRC